MNKYAVFVFWSADETCWVAECPDLPLCAAYGDTKKEALRGLKDAQRLWLHVAPEQKRAIPSPGRWKVVRE